MEPLVSSSLAGTSVPSHKPATGLDTVPDFDHAGAQLRVNWRGKPWQAVSVVTPTDGPFWSAVEMTLGQARAVAALVAEYDRLHSPPAPSWNPSLETAPGAKPQQGAATTSLGLMRAPCGEAKSALMGPLKPAANPVPTKPGFYWLRPKPPFGGEWQPVHVATVQGKLRFLQFDWSSWVDVSESERRGMEWGGECVLPATEGCP